MAKIIIGAGAGASLMAIVMTTIVPQITNFEGTKTVAYKDIGGILTVCSGHTGPDVTVKKVYTPSQCANLTQADAQKAASGVLKVSPQLLYHPMVLAAAVSFSYNVGVGTYAQSTVAKLFNEGQFVNGCNYLINYKYADGKVSQGLLDRRMKERTLCLSTLTPKGLNDVGLAPIAGK